MRLQDLGEFAFIERVSRLVHCERDDVVLGIGDDCALILSPSGDTLAVTTDAVVEGVHFRLDWLTPYEIGARAMTACLSDTAAMGAEPAFAFSSVALPPEMEVKEAEEMLRGLVGQAERFGACLLGGDTVASSNQIILDVMLIGRCRSQIWRRDSASAGEVVAVTGALGGCGAAIAARRAGWTDIPTWHRYAQPTPRVTQAALLSEVGAISACIDISDGLVQDAGHLCQRSGVGIIIEADRVPVSDEAEAIAATLKLDALTWALTGGEEFELLFTAPETAISSLQAAADIPVTVIGRVTVGDHVEVSGMDGWRLAGLWSGWNHFAVR